MRAQTEADRHLPDETHRAFLDAGLYRVLQPARYGGYELDLGIMVDVAAELGRGCGSSAWIFTNLVAQSWATGMKHPEAQDELWGDDPQALVASSFPGPDASITRIDGGFRVNGDLENTRAGSTSPRAITSSSSCGPKMDRPSIDFAFVPTVPDYEIVDDWFVHRARRHGEQNRSS